MPGPRKGFNLHPPAIQPTNGGTFTVGTSLERQALMGADTARVVITWGKTNYQIAHYPIAPLQVSFSDPINYAQLDYLIGLIDYVRVLKPDFSILITMNAPPSDLDGISSNGYYIESFAGWDQLGYTTATVVNYLNSNLSSSPPRCIGVELGNEPNYKIHGIDANGQTFVRNGATEVPGFQYAAMAAYVLFWIYQCCGGFNSAGDLKVKPLFGSIATGGTVDAWTEGMSPTQYTQYVSGCIDFVLGLILPNNMPLRTNLNKAWRLSIHPYPRPGQKTISSPPGWATNPANTTGDVTGVMAADRVLNRYADFQVLHAARKVWITETGVSSRKVGQQGQVDFHDKIGYILNYLHSTGDRRLEGIINFGLTDLEPLMSDLDSDFFEFGVIHKTDGSTYKPAAHKLRDIFTNIWI